MFIWRLCLVLIGSYILLTPTFDILSGYNAYNEKRVLQCTLLVVLGLCTLLSAPMRQRWLSLWLQFTPTSRRLIFSLLLLGLLSAFSASIPGRALLELWLFVLLFSAALLIAEVQKSAAKDFAYIIPFIFSAVSIFYMVRIFAGYTAVFVEGLPLLQPELFGNFSNIRFFNQAQSWMLPLIILPVIALRQHKPVYFLLALIAAIGFYFMLFLSGGRGTLLGIAAALIFMPAIFGRRASTWLKWQVYAFVGGALVYYIFFMLVPSLASAETGDILRRTIERDLTSSPKRIILWQQALDFIRQAPLLGVGPMHYACDPSNRIAAHPHNAILQIASEWGLPVAVIVIFLFFKGLYYWQNELKSTSSAQIKPCFETTVNIALSASIVTATIHALVSGIIVMPLSQILAILIIGWMLGIYFNKPPSPARPHLSTYALVLTLVIALVGFLATVFPEIIYIEQLEQQYQQTSPHRTLPRFWQQGKICP